MPGPRPGRRRRRERGPPPTLRPARAARQRRTFRPEQSETARHRDHHHGLCAADADGAAADRAGRADPPVVVMVWLAMLTLGPALAAAAAVLQGAGAIARGIVDRKPQQRSAADHRPSVFPRRRAALSRRAGGCIAVEPDVLMTLLAIDIAGVLVSWLLFIHLMLRPAPSTGAPRRRDPQRRAVRVAVPASRQFARAAVVRDLSLDRVRLRFPLRRADAARRRAALYRRLHRGSVNHAVSGRRSRGSRRGFIWR